MRRAWKHRVRRLIVRTTSLGWAIVFAAVVPPFPGQFVVATLPPALALTLWTD